MIVLDASAVIELLLSTPSGQLVAARICDSSQELHVPELLDLEVCQVVRRLVRGGRPKPLSKISGARAIANLASLDIVRHAHLPLIPRIWELKDNLSAYDAAYVALAEGLRCPLLTHDPKLARAPGHRAQVEVI